MRRNTRAGLRALTLSKHVRFLAEDVYTVRQKISTFDTQRTFAHYPLEQPGDLKPYHASQEN